MIRVLAFAALSACLMSFPLFGQTQSATDDWLEEIRSGSGQSPNGGFSSAVTSFSLLKGDNNFPSYSDIERLGFSLSHVGVVQTAGGGITEKMYVELVAVDKLDKPTTVWLCYLEVSAERLDLLVNRKRFPLSEANCLIDLSEN